MEKSIYMPIEWLNVLITRMFLLTESPLTIKSCLRVRLYINKNIIMIMYYSVESILRSFIDIDDRNKRIILSIYDVNVSCIVTPLSLAVTHHHNSPCWRIFWIIQISISQFSLHHSMKIKCSLSRFGELHFYLLSTMRWSQNKSWTLILAF